MDRLQNFGPNDAQNGTLAQMFRNAGIDDVRSYVDDVRHGSTELDDTDVPVSIGNAAHPGRKSNRLGEFLGNSQGKNPLGNAKQIYQMYKSMDKNGDGKITVEDVEIILKDMGLGFFSKHLARAIFDLVDMNHNGQLDFRDLLALTSILKRLSSSSAK